MRFGGLILLLLLLGYSPYAQSNAKFALTCLNPCVVIESAKDSPQNITWSGPKSFYSAQQNPTVCEPGIYKYKFLKDGAWKYDSVLVENQKFIPTADAGAHRELTCVFNCIEIKGNNPGSNFGATWQGPSGFVANNTDIKICKPGRYIYEIFKGVCHSYDTILVKENKVNLVAEAGENIELNCKQPNAKLQATFPGNEYTYEWLLPNGKLFSTQLRPRIEQTGVYYFKIKRGVCEAKDSVKVTADFRKPTVKGIRNYKLPCNNKDLVLSLTCEEKEAKFEWKDINNQLISNTLKENFNSSNKYFLKSYNEKNGCSDTFSIQIAPRDSIFFDYSTIGACAAAANGEINLKKVGGGVGPYEISLKESGFEKTKTIKELKSGNYQLFVKDQNGCISVAPFSIDNQRPFNWKLPSEFEFCSYEQALTIDASVKDPAAANVQYIWSNGSSSEKHVFTTSEKVWVEAFNGCYSERKYIDIKDRFDVIKSTQYYSPNVFNPLSINAANRCFRPFLGFPTQQYQLSIYDRWGNLVFQTNDKDACWDGTFRGKNINFGTFFWQITAQIDGCGHPVPWQKSGGITVFSEE